MAIFSNSKGRRGTIVRGLVVFLLSFVFISLVLLSVMVVCLDKAIYPANGTEKWYLPKRVYEVEGAIRIAPVVIPIVLLSEDDRDVVTEFYQSFMNTQAEMIMSTRVLQRVADDLAEKNLTFFEDYGGWLSARSRRKADEGAMMTGPVEVLKWAIRNGVIEASAVVNTELIQVTMRSANPEEARQIVDSFISSYMAVEAMTSDMRDDQMLSVLENESKKLAMKLKRIREKIGQLSQEYSTATSEIQELEDNLGLDKERYDAISRRINEIKMERKRPGRISVAYYAKVVSVETFGGKRFKTTIAVLLSALVCSAVLAIVTGRSGRKSRTVAKSKVWEVT
ncbi:MAG: hypothetical protein ACYS67_12055 [Planctomycetota bacterium]|jgi:hypothetical protein